MGKGKGIQCNEKGVPDISSEPPRHFRRELSELFGLPYQLWPCCWRLYKAHEQRAMSLGIEGKMCRLARLVLQTHCDATWDGSSLQIPAKDFMEAKHPKGDWVVLLSRKLEKCENKKGKGSKSCDYIRKWVPEAKSV